MIRLRENIQTTLLFHLLYLLVFTLLFLSTGHEFMHNHEPDSHDHHDCPAYQIDFLLSSFVIIYFFFSAIITIALSFPFQQIHLIDSTLHREIYPRAPPLAL